MGFPPYIGREKRRIEIERPWFDPIVIEQEREVDFHAPERVREYFESKRPKFIRAICGGEVLIGHGSWVVHECDVTTGKWTCRHYLDMSFVPTPRPWPGLSTD